MFWQGFVAAAVIIFLAFLLPPLIFKGPRNDLVTLQVTIWQTTGLQIGIMVGLFSALASLIK